MKKDKIKKANPIVYTLYYWICKFVSKFIFNLEIQRNEIKGVKGPYLVLANHESFIDFINMTAACKTKHHFLVSNSFFHSMKINPLIKATGAIPKQQFQFSLHSLRDMKEVIKANRSLVIYPAGMMSENGITTPIPKGTGRIFKYLSTDIYIAKTSGSYLTNPKWGKGFRKGKVTLDIYKLFSKEDIDKFDNDYIQQVIEEKLYYSAYDDQEKNMVKFKHGNNIKGLENVLYKCLKCNSEFSIYHDNHKLICKNCNNQAIADKYGFLNKVKDDDIIYKKPSDWSKKIIDDLYEEIINDENYTMTDRCEIKMINYKKHKFETVGNGIITLNKDNFIINGIINNQEISKEFSIKETFILPFTPGKHFEIQENDTVYRIILNNKIHTEKWLLVLQIFYKIRHTSLTHNK